MAAIIVASRREWRQGDGAATIAVAIGWLRVRTYVSQLLDLPIEARRASLRPAALVLTATMAVVVAVAWIVRIDDERMARGQVRAFAEQVAVVFRETLSAYEQALRGGVGLHDALGSITRQSWHTYFQGLKVQHHYPGIQGLGFASRVAPGEIDRVEAAARADGLTDFTLTPAGEREEMTTILMLEPLDWRNRRALGYDMYSDTVRREAMQRARDTGEATLSRSVVLQQETGEDTQRGLLLYLPVYRQGASLQTVEERRSALVGYVFAAFRLKDLLTAIQSRAERYGAGPVEIELHEGEGPGATLLYSSRAAVTGEPRYRSIVPLSEQGTSFTLSVGSTVALEALASTSRPLVVLLIGALTGLLLAVIVGLLGMGRETARVAARKLSAEATIRRMAEEQAVLATRELTHRAKNSLSVVSAIATQTLRSSDTLADFDVAFRSRLQALGKVHDLLAAGRTYDTDLSALASEVLRPYNSERSERLKIEGPALALDPNVAVLLSIVLNELATNAMKYGAWRSQAGHVDLLWRIVPCETGDRLNVTWRECGIEVPAEPRRAGFGTNVIKLTIERSLKGSVKCAFSPEGVLYELSLPVAALRAEPPSTHGANPA